MFDITKTNFEIFFNVKIFKFSGDFQGLSERIPGNPQKVKKLENLNIENKNRNLEN